MAATQLRRIALTGGIATGKSHVRARFEALGVPTIDADVLARDAVRPGSPALAELVRCFGADVLDATGALDRRKLGAIVFEHPTDRRTLEAIVHPGVRQAMKQWFDSLPPSTPFAIADIPLLFETGREREFDAVVVTACHSETQVRRMMERDHLSAVEARRRLAAQLPIDEKVRKADHVIRTEGSFEDTNAQIEAVYRELVPRAS